MSSSTTCSRYASRLPGGRSLDGPGFAAGWAPAPGRTRGRPRTGHWRGPGDRAAGALPRVPCLAPPDRPHKGPEPRAGRGPPAAWRGPRGAAGDRVPAAPPRAAARGAAAGGPLGPRPARGVGRARGDGRTVPDDRGPRTARRGALPVRARVRRRAPQRPAPVRRAPGSCPGPPRPRPRGRAPRDADRRETAAVHPRGVRAPLRRAEGRAEGDQAPAGGPGPAPRLRRLDRAAPPVPRGGARPDLRLLRARQLLPLHRARRPAAPRGPGRRARTPSRRGPRVLGGARARPVHRTPDRPPGPGRGRGPAPAASAPPDRGGGRDGPDRTDRRRACKPARARGRDPRRGGARGAGLHQCRRPRGLRPSAERGLPPARRDRIGGRPRQPGLEGGPHRAKGHRQARPERTRQRGLYGGFAPPGHPCIPRGAPGRASLLAPRHEVPRHPRLARRAEGGDPAGPRSGGPGRARPRCTRRRGDRRPYPSPVPAGGRPGPVHQPRERREGLGIRRHPAGRVRPAPALSVRPLPPLDPLRGAGRRSCRPGRNRGGRGDSREPCRPGADGQPGDGVHRPRHELDPAAGGPTERAGCVHGPLRPEGDRPARGGRVRDGPPRRRGHGSGRSCCGPLRPARPLVRRGGDRGSRDVGRAGSPEQGSPALAAEDRDGPRRSRHPGAGGGSPDLPRRLERPRARRPDRPFYRHRGREHRDSRRHGERPHLPLERQAGLAPAPGPLSAPGTRRSIRRGGIRRSARVPANRHCSGPSRTSPVIGSRRSSGPPGRSRPWPRSPGG